MSERGMRKNTEDLTEAMSEELSESPDESLTEAESEAESETDSSSRRYASGKLSSRANTAGSPETEIKSGSSAAGKTEKP